MNWGKAILIFFIFYVGTLTFILLNSFRQDHQLVIEDYYKEDLAYQSRYEKEINTKELNQKPKISYDREQKITYIEFGDIDLEKKGLVWLYRPSDKKKDRSLPFQLPSGDKLLALKASPLDKGRWIVKLNWTQGFKEYYLEDELIIY